MRLKEEILRSCAESDSLRTIAVAAVEVLCDIRAMIAQGALQKRRQGQNPTVLAYDYNLTDDQKESLSPEVNPKKGKE